MFLKYLSHATDSLIFSFVIVLCFFSKNLRASSNLPPTFCLTNLAEITGALSFQKSSAPDINPHFPFTPKSEPSFFEKTAPKEISDLARQLDFAFSISRGRIFLVKLDLPGAAYNDLSDLFWIHLEIENLIKLKFEIDQSPETLSPLASEIISWLIKTYPSKYKTPSAELLQKLTTNPLPLVKELEKTAQTIVEDLNFKEILFLGQKTPLQVLFGSNLPAKSPYSWIMAGALSTDLKGIDVFGGILKIFEEKLTQFQKALLQNPLSPEAKAILKKRMEELDLQVNLLLLKRTQAENQTVDLLQKQAIRKSYAAAINDISLEKQTLIRILGPTN